MQLNSVHYMLFSKGPIKPDGSFEMSLRAQSNHPALMQKAAKDLGLTQYAITVCTCIISTVDEPLVSPIIQPTTSSN